jgi:CRP-like cAMP-binding protein
MDRRTFLWSMEEMPAVARNLVGILSRRLRLADTHTRSLAALDVHGRVAAQILAFAREYGEPRSDGGVLIPLRLTQTDLARLCPAVLADHEWISFSRGPASIGLGVGWLFERSNTHLNREVCVWRS